MNRLIAFGCSHTYGMGLSDCYLGKNNNFTPGPLPSAYAWPSLISEKSGLECVNKGICGASNLEILTEITQFDFKKNDKVIVAWTTPYRDLLAFNEYNLRIGSFMIDNTFSKEELLSSIEGISISNIDPAKIKKIAQNYFQAHSLTDMEIRSWLCQHTAGLFLKSRHIDFKFITMWGWNQNNSVFTSYIDSANILNNIKKIDYALDGRHFGPVVHKQIAKKLTSL